MSDVQTGPGWVECADWAPEGTAKVNYGPPPEGSAVVYQIGDAAAPFIVVTGPFADDWTPPPG